MKFPLFFFLFLSSWLFAQEPPPTAEKSALTVQLGTPQRVMHERTLAAEGEGGCRRPCAGWAGAGFV